MYSSYVSYVGLRCRLLGRSAVPIVSRVSSRVDSGIMFFGSTLARDPQGSESGNVHWEPLFSQSVSYFTVPPRAHPSTGSQSGSATPGQTQVPSTRSRGGLLNCRKCEVSCEVNLSAADRVLPAAFCPVGRGSCGPFSRITPLLPQDHRKSQHIALRPRHEL